MKLYTSKIVAAWLGLSERRVRMLRDEGVVEEKRPGLYDLQPTVSRYITYIRKGTGKTDLNDERAMLTKAKREAAEMENKRMRGELHRTADIERGLQTMMLNMRGRLMSLPAKLSPELANMGGNQPGIFDALKLAINEVLEELSNYKVSFAEQDGDEDQ